MVRGPTPGGAQAARVLSSKRRYDIDSLTDVALRVFARKGYDGASMDDVATEAGITKASIYHHARGKEALLARGLGRALDALEAILTERDATAGGAAERVRYVVRRVAETTTRHLAEVTVLFRVRGNSETERNALERRRRFDRKVAELVAAAQKDGALRDDLDPGLVTRLTFGMSNSVVEWYRAGGSIDESSLTKAILALIFDGLSRA
ncbi:MAG: TetR family transcriptional regulator [Candidatus Eremiobacteraeota bacterium]|nr:TetR family transcriptional regulator [Candidatus Eremiobacteraeota bacterium]